MKPGIPKSVQDLLARQTPKDEHPSADVLNGYVEQSLTAGERAQVMSHLAACEDCREIVFLAGAVEEEQMVPAVAAATPARQEQVAAAGTRSGSKWPWWKWAVPAFAVIAVGVGVLIQQNRIAERAHPASETLALNYPASSPATGNRDNAVTPEPPARPADKARQIAPTESRKHPTAEPGWNENSEQGRRIEQERALQKSRDLAQLSSSLENSRPNAIGGAVTGMRAAPHANPVQLVVSGDVTGTVTDASGAVVSNATVILKNKGTGQTRSTTTNNTGVYRFSLLQPGSYTVSASATGFSKAETTAMINVGQATVADMKLAVGSSSQTAEVTSAAPLLQADNGDLSTNFKQGLISNQPSGGNDLTYIQQSAPSAQGGKDERAAAPSAELKSGLASSGKPGSAAATQLAKAMLPGVHWRISAEGHLERALPGSAWTRVLGDQPVAFRAVATIASSVWVGGNDGALFHSVDQGTTWRRVALSTNGHSERGAITSIRFDNAMQGSVTTDSGATWVTSDGGQTWIPQ